MRAHKNVGKHQSCMVSKLRIIWKQTVQHSSKHYLMRRRVGAGQFLVETRVAAAQVGLVIGKGGATIKALMKESGAFIQTQRDDEDLLFDSKTHHYRRGRGGSRGSKHNSGAGQEMVDGRTVYIIGTVVQIEAAKQLLDAAVQLSPSLSSQDEILATGDGAKSRQAEGQVQQLPASGGIGTVVDASSTSPASSTPPPPPPPPPPAAAAAAAEWLTCCTPRY